MSGLGDGTINILDLVKGTYILSLTGHTGHITSLIQPLHPCYYSSLLQDSSSFIIVSGSIDGTMKVWKLQNIDGNTKLEENYEEKMEKKKNEDVNDIFSCWKSFTHENSQIGFYPAMVNSICEISSYIATATGDGRVWIRDILKDECIRILKVINSGISTIMPLFPINSNNQDRSHFLLGSCGTDILLWNIQTGECIKTLKSHKYLILSLTRLSEDRIVTSSMDQTIKIWNLQSGHCEKTIGFSNEGELSTFFKAYPECRLFQAKETKTIIRSLKLKTFHSLFEESIEIWTPSIHHD